MTTQQQVDSHRPPDSVVLMFKLWMGAVALECLHQLANIVMGILNPGPLLEQGRKSVENMPRMQATDEQLQVATYFSIIANGVLAITILALVAYAAWRFLKQQRFATNMRRMLLFFGIYLGMRGLAPFFMEPQPGIPTAFILADGSVQILVAVAAVLAAILGSKQESVQWALDAEPASASSSSSPKR